MNHAEDTRVLRIVTNSPAETTVVGQRIGEVLKGGEVIALTGPLGSGKTQFVKGIAMGAGVSDSSRVSSPTFVIVNEYLSDCGGVDIYHIDAYRIESAGEFEMLGFDELCYDRSVVIVEWADKVAGSMQGIPVIRIEMSHQGENTRSISFACLTVHMKSLFA